MLKTKHKVDVTMANQDQIDRITSYIDSVEWKFAKTYANTAPHEYTIRKWNPNLDDMFVEMAQFIREWGYVEYFYRTPFRYFNFGELKYWTMNETIENTNIINRAMIKKVYK